MRVRLNEDVTIQNAQAAGVDVSGQYYFLCLSTQPLPKKATEIPRQTILPGETAIDYLEIVLMVNFVMLHCFHMCWFQHSLSAKTLRSLTKTKETQ